MLKASWGGGGRGMRVVESDAQLAELLPVARREAKAAFGNDEVYLEKLVRRARHVEVQILGDAHGSLVHLYERDCTVQRRNQKVVERAPAVFLSDAQRAELCEAALAIGRAANYLNAGTVEFLQDADSGKFYFIEVNPRIQVEHTVTECATGIDIVKAQIRIAGGRAARRRRRAACRRRRRSGSAAHALQCRVTTEDPENNFIPDYGKITAYRSPAGFGIRLDAGTAYTGRDHHPLLRLAAGEGDGLGADAGGDHRAHAPRAVGVPHPRRRHQPALPRSGHHAPAVRARRVHHAIHRRDAGAVPLAARSATAPRAS